MTIEKGMPAAQKRAGEEMTLRHIVLFSMVTVGILVVGVFLLQDSVKNLTVENSALREQITDYRLAGQNAVEFMGLSGSVCTLFNGTWLSGESRSVATEVIHNLMVEKGDVLRAYRCHLGDGRNITAIFVGRSIPIVKISTPYPRVAGAEGW